MSRSPDHDPPIVLDGQESLFPENPLRPTIERQFTYECTKCGSNSLIGIHPTTDSSGRYACATKCSDCKTKHVVAVRREVKLPS